MIPSRSLQEFLERTERAPSPSALDRSDQAANALGTMGSSLPARLSYEAIACSVLIDRMQEFHEEAFRFLSSTVFKFLKH